MNSPKSTWRRIAIYNVIIVVCLAAMLEFAAWGILAVHRSNLDAQALRLANIPESSEQPDATEQSYSDISVRRDLDAAKTQIGGSYRYEPFLIYLPRAFSSEFVNVSEQGFRRNRRISADDTNPDYKIWMFGSSALFGVSNADHETIPAYLESILSERYPHLEFQVRNFGVVGYLSLQDYLHLKIRSLSDSPDLVIAFNGVNDHYAAFLNDSPRTAVSHINVLPREVLQHYVRMHQTEDIINWPIIIRRTVSLFQNTTTLIGKIFKYFSLRSANKNIDAWKQSYRDRKNTHLSQSSVLVPTMRDFYIDNMRHFIDVAKDQKAGVILAHQPLLFATTKPLVGNERLEDAHPRLNFFALDDDSIDALSEVPSYHLNQKAYWSMDNFLSSYEEQAEALKALSTASEVRYVDVQSFIDRSGPVAIFTSPYHFTFRGAQKIAEGLIPAVEEELNLSKSWP